MPFTPNEGGELDHVVSLAVPERARKWAKFEYRKECMRPQSSFLSGQEPE